MLARITRFVPEHHPLFVGAPLGRAQRESFDQQLMTKLLREELESMGYMPFRINASRRNGSGEPKAYQFDVKLDGDASYFDMRCAGMFDAQFSTSYEALEDGGSFALDAEGDAHSAVAAVGAIISGD